MLLADAPSEELTQVAEPQEKRVSKALPGDPQFLQAQQGVPAAGGLPGNREDAAMLLLACLIWLSQCQ